MNLSKCWYYCSLVGEREKALELSCNIRLWVVLLLPEVLWCASLSIASRSAVILYVARYLSQLLCRVFASHLCALHARASQQFGTFCFHNLHRKGPKKRWSFLRKCPTFFFFSPTFSEKCRTFLWASSHVFESWLQFEDNGLLWKSLFPFFCRKNASFQHSCVKVVKAKKRKSQGTRPRVTCAREKVIFLKVKSYPLQVCFTDGKNGYRFLFPLSNTLSHRIMTIVFFVKQYDQV